MVNFRGEASPSPESNKFNISDFPPGTDILFFDDNSKKYYIGQVTSWQNPVMDLNGKLNGKIWAQKFGGDVDVQLSLTPKKLDKFPYDPAKRFNINGKKYKVDISQNHVIQNTGEVEVTLVNEADPTDRLVDISLKTIANLESVERFEADIEAKVQKLKKEVIDNANARAKTVLVELATLQTKIAKVAEQFGAVSDWKDIDQAEAEQIGQAIKRLEAEINADLVDLENKLKNTEKRKEGKDALAAEAAGLQVRLDFKVEEIEKALKGAHKIEMDDYDQKNTQWKKDYDAWKKGKPPVGTEPTPPIKPELDLSGVKKKAAYDLYTDLAAVTGKHKEIIDKVTTEVDKQAKLMGFSGINDVKFVDKEKVIVDVFQKVLNQEKTSVAEAAEELDLKTEKNELKTKIKELMARAKAVGLTKNTNGKTADEWLLEIENISPVTPLTSKKAIDKKLEEDILNQWDNIRTFELVVFSAEQEKIPTPERVEAEKDIDVPDILLMELLAYRGVEVQTAVKELYSGLLDLGDGNKNVKILEAVKNIFDDRLPNQAMRDKLAEHGIRNWSTFKKTWDKKLHIQVAAVLNDWAKGQLKNQAQGGVMNFLKNNGGGALVNMAVSLGLTYGGAQIGGLVAERYAKDMADASSKAAVVFASKVGGGTLAGMAKAGFHKLTGGIFARKQNNAAESAEKKAIDLLIKEQFAVKTDNNGILLPPTGMVEFSALLSQSLRDISSQAVAGDKNDFTFEEAKKLKGDARRIYINHLKKMREEGKDVTEQMQLSLAIACEELMGNLEIKQEQFASPEHMGIITTIEEGQKYLGYKKGVVAGALVGGGVTAAFMTAGAYVPVLSTVLGTASGMTMGYRMADKWHENSKIKSGKKNFTALFEQTSNVFGQYLVDINVKTDKAANDLLMNNVQRINRLVKGKADSEADLEMMQYLNSDQNLLARVKNLLYESHRSGLFAEQALQKLQEQAEKIKKESEAQEFSKNKKQAIRALGAIVGGAAGGWLAMTVGVAFAQHRLEGQTEHNIKANADYFDKVTKGQIEADAKIPVATAASIAAERAAAAPVVAEAAPVVEVEEPRPAGLIEAPEKVTGINDWRHQIMGKMGYRFHGGKIDHALRFHEGAKFVLKHHDGTPVVDAKGHALEYTFKKGGSTWGALDHLQNKAKGLIKAGDIPTIKIEGVDTGKVEVLDNYSVESRVGGKTHMATGEAVKPEEIPVRDVGPNEFKKGYYSEQHTDAKGHTFDDKHSTFYGRSGKAYTPVFSRDAIGDSTLFAFKDEDGNLFGSIKGDYIATAGSRAHVDVSGAASSVVHDKIAWSSGGAIENKSALESMLKGTAPAGGPATEAVPYSGAKVGGAVTAPEISKGESPITNEVPAGFKGHEAEYNILQNIKTNVVENLRKDEGFVLKDRAGEMNKLLSLVETALQKNPALFKDSVISRALDNNIMNPTYERLAILVEQLDGKGIIKITDEQDILLELKMSDNLERFNQVVNGENYTFTVVKGDGGHAMSAVDSEGHRMVKTDPKILFTKANVISFLKK